MEANIIANVSLKFEEAGVGADIPILSAYETKATKIADVFLWSRKTVLMNVIMWNSTHTKTSTACF
jgi:hypothetical protein